MRIWLTVVDGKKGDVEGGDLEDNGRISINR